jgi:iron complex outermembrane receptor protein
MMFKLDITRWTALPIEVIKRIEIIKATSRVFGQNAFTGAVISLQRIRLIMMLHYVFRRVLMASLVLLLPRELVWLKAIIFFFFKNISNGYRYNTDFDNQNFVLKSVFNKINCQYDVGCSFGKKSLGQMVSMLRQRLLINMRKQLV